MLLQQIAQISIRNKLKKKKSPKNFKEVVEKKKQIELMVIGKTLNMVNCHKNGTWHFWEGNT